MLGHGAGSVAMGLVVAGLPFLPAGAAEATASSCAACGHELLLNGGAELGHALEGGLERGSVTLRSCPQRGDL